MVIKGRRREGKSSVNNTAARRQLEAHLHQKGQIDEIFSLAVQYHQRGNFQYADILSGLENNAEIIIIYFPIL